MIWPLIESLNLVQSGTGGVTDVLTTTVVGESFWWVRDGLADLGTWLPGRPAQQDPAQASGCWRWI